MSWAAVGAWALEELAEYSREQTDFPGEGNTADLLLTQSLKQKALEC